MTSAVRPVSLRLLAVALPVALACWGGLTLARLAELPQSLSPTPGWDLAMSLALGAGSALVHGAAVRLSSARPARAAAFVLAGLPVVVALATAQVTYAVGALAHGVEGGFARLTDVGDEAVGQWALSLGILLGAAAALALPLVHDAWCRAADGRPSRGRGLGLTLGVGVGLLALGGATHAIFRAVAPDTWAHKLLLSALAVASLAAFVVGAPLVVLLAWASLLEDRLQGRTPPSPLYRG